MHDDPPETHFPQGPAATLAKEPLLSLRHATVVKGRQQRILDDISLTIPEGEHTAILGPNGSGKSSLLKLITREYYPLAPRSRDERAAAAESFQPGGNVAPVAIFGRERWDVFALRSLLGIVSADLLQSMSTSTHSGLVGLDAVLSGFFASLGLFRHQEVTPAMRERAHYALHRMDAEYLAPKPLTEMSTGEARRVLIARALVHEPRALLLDEPSSGLDLLAASRLLETLRQIARSGTTLLLVTHHLTEILPEIERVVLISRGRIAADGPKQATLTAVNLTELFGAPIQLQQRASGYYSASVEDQ